MAPATQITSAPCRAPISTQLFHRGFSSHSIAPLGYGYHCGLLIVLGEEESDFWSRSRVRAIDTCSSRRQSAALRSWSMTMDGTHLVTANSERQQAFPLWNAASCVIGFPPDTSMASTLWRRRRTWRLSFDVLGTCVHKNPDDTMQSWHYSFLDTASLGL